jgi:hypothetical protein
MMNFGDGESQIVEFSPGFPNHGAFFFLDVLDRDSSPKTRGTSDAAGRRSSGSTPHLFLHRAFHDFSFLEAVNLVSIRPRSGWRSKSGRIADLVAVAEVSGRENGGKES